MTQYHYVMNIMDNNANGGPFMDLYNAVYDADKYSLTGADEVLFAEAVGNYCFDNIHGLAEYYPTFNNGLFDGAVLVFNDQASFSWFLLRLS
jgi:hypothetical protein